MDIDFKKVTGHKECWSADKAWEWYRRRPLIVGFNYIPAYAVNSTEFWQNGSFDRKAVAQELSWAAEYGYNCARVFLPYILFEREREAFLKNIEIFLSVAAEKNIRVMPVLFDDCAFSGLLPYYGKQNEPAPLTHNSGWTPSPGLLYSENLSKYGGLEDYVKTIIGLYKNDERVLMWDLYNECGNNGRGSKSLYFLLKTFEWARAVSPSQPLTAGAWALHYDVKDDVLFCDMTALELSDIITFHRYADAAETRAFIKELKKTGRPLVCTEWMARVRFNSLIPSVLPVFAAENVGSVHWGLVNGKTQTHIPWDHDKSKGEPEVWFHDVFHGDGRPYDEAEMQAVKKTTGN